MNRIIQILFLTFFSITLFSQKINYKKFTVNNGLPVNNVTCAVQDGDGFMWFGTDFGIVKFDGKNFQHFYKKDGMANKAAYCLAYAGGDSILFMSYPDVIQAIHTKTGKISDVIKKNIAAGLVGNYENDYYFYNRNTNVSYNYHNKEISKISLDSITQDKTTTQSCIIPISKTELIFCTNKGLLISSSDQTKILFKDINFMHGIKTKNKSFVFATNIGIMTLDENFTIITINTQMQKDVNILHMAEDDDGAIWLRGMNKYIFRYNNNIVKDESENLGLFGKTINTMYKDASGNMWFCTNSDGIVLKPKTIIKNYNTSNGLSNNSIQTLFLQKNKLWIGTENGLNTFENNTFENIETIQNEKSRDYVYKIIASTNDTISIALKSPLFQHYQNKDFLIKKTKTNNIKLYNKTNIWQQDEHTIWQTSSYGSFIIEKNGAPTFTLKLEKYGIRRIYSFLKVEEKIWLGTDKGIIIYMETNNMEQINELANEKIGEVFDIVKDNNGTLWIATDNGLFNYTNKVFTAILKGKTIGSNYCKKIIIDEENNKWVATWDGLIRIKNNQMETFNSGLSSKVINDLAYNVETKEFYLATDNGLSVFSKLNITKDNKLPKVFINSFYILDGVQFPFKENDKLSSKKNNVLLNVSIPYYENLDDIYFEYKLDNNDWVSSKDAFITLNKLSNGTHKILVKAGISGIGNYSDITMFIITIETPFYKTWWFILLSILTIQALILYAIYYFNKKDKEKKITALQKINEQASLKQQAFTSLLNPHFIFNSLNSIQYFINKQDRINANKYLSDFASLIRKNFDAAQKQFLPLENEIENLRLYLQLEQMRFNNKLDYTIHIAETVEPDDWMIPTLILQPFVENALLHGIISLSHQGILNITIHTSKDKIGNELLIIAIADNGIGIANSTIQNKGKNHTSRGMQLIKERLEILSKVSKNNIALNITNQFEDIKDYPGTIVTLSYPIGVYDAYIKINQRYHK